MNLYHELILDASDFQSILSYFNSLLTTNIIFYLSVKDKISISLVHLLYIFVQNRTYLTYVTSNINNINCQWKWMIEFTDRILLFTYLMSYKKSIFSFLNS